MIQQSNEVHVTFVDGNVYTAKAIGKDVFSDLAVLQLDKSAVLKENLAPLPLADSSAIEVGQQIAVIGNPFGLSGSMTHGIVSQLYRLLPDPEFKFSLPGIIQIDAANKSWQFWWSTSELVRRSYRCNNCNRFKHWHFLWNRFCNTLKNRTKNHTTAHIAR